MADKKETTTKTGANDAVIEKAKDFWSKYSKYITGISAAIIVLVGGFISIKTFLKTLKSRKP